MITNSKYKNIYNQKSTLNNILAEKIIIGFLLSNLSSNKILEGSLNRYFFSIKIYRLLYTFFINLDKKNGKVQVFKVINQIWKKKLLKKIGSLHNLIYLIQTSQNFYLSSNENINIKYFINLLYYYYIRRLFIQHSYSIIQASYFYNLSINTLYSLAAKQLNGIAKNHHFYELRHNNSGIIEVFNSIKKDDQDDPKMLSGIEYLDNITKGFKEGDLIIIAGRPSMGKTSFVINIINYLSIELYYKVHMFSLEMSRKEILFRMLSLLSNLPIERIQRNLLFGKDWDNLQRCGSILINSPLLIDEKGSASIEYIKSQCQNNNANNAIIVIDYLQLIQVESLRTDNRAQEIGHITRSLKLLVRNLDATALVLSQLNRNIENRNNKRPLLSDLRESGCIALSHTSQLNYHADKESFSIVCCFKRYYTFNKINKIKRYESQKQYTFSLINLTKEFISTTHNHKIFAYHFWSKEDQLKYNEFNTINNNEEGDAKYTLELNKSLQVKFLGKTRVYDIALEYYHNFIIGTYIVHNSIEQDADLVLMLYKNEHYSKEKIIDIVIAKHRHGPIGSFQLLFHADVCKFSNVVSDAINC